MKVLHIVKEIAFLEDTLSIQSVSSISCVRIDCPWHAVSCALIKHADKLLNSLKTSTWCVSDFLYKLLNQFLLGNGNCNGKCVAALCRSLSLQGSKALPQGPAVCCSMRQHHCQVYSSS